MATLRIEHPITDIDTWLGAFGRFADARQRAGVRSHRVHQPDDDDHYICVDLEFDTTEQAAVFRTFLEANVWSSPAASPGLAGTPRARVLVEVAAAGPRSSA